MSNFAGLGTVGHNYIRQGMEILEVNMMVSTYECASSLFTVYNCCGYMDIVGRAAELSMRCAVDEVKAHPDYDTQGEVHVHVYCTL